MNRGTRWYVSFLLLTTIVGLCCGAWKVNLPPAERKFKIGMLLPFGPQSHRNCFLTLAEGLAERGHEVGVTASYSVNFCGGSEPPPQILDFRIVILSSLPPKSKHPNIKEINHGIYVMTGNQSLFDIRETDRTGGLEHFATILPKLAREMYDVPAVKEFFNKRKEFDVFLIDELFNEPAYPFLEGKNFIFISPPGFLAPSSAVMGNVMNPAYVPGLLVDYPRPYSFLQRAQNLFVHLFIPFHWRKLKVVPLVQKEISLKFPDLPPLLEIEKGVSLVLANTHFSLDFPMTLLPSQVEVGGMHCRPGKNLPQDLESFINDSGPNGVIYFSLGSVCQGKTIPEKYKKILIEVFSGLKQRVIWKFEEEFKGLPKNIMVKSWLPQQDILSHPKVKLFITHGGILSMQESLYHGKPLLALPVFGDQGKNAQRIENKGYGKFLVWEKMTPQSLSSTIDEIINEPKYRDTVTSVSSAFRDQQTSPLEKGIWWVEYIIRHKGAPQLRSPAADISWIEYLNLDVILVIHFVIFILYWLSKKAIFCLYSVLFKPTKSQNKKKKKD